MNIVVIFGSQRMGGTNGEIKKVLKELNTVHKFDFIHLAEKKVEGCTSCPLLNKKVGIFSYCSSQSCDDSVMKLIFDKFVMKNYRFDVSTYRYLNDHDFQKYSDIIDYVKDIAVRL